MKKTRSRQKITLKEVRMATKSKKQKLEEETTLFGQPDVILEVEDKQFHVRKQVLAENSPVFRRMFESDFKERRDFRIPLPEKKFKDFEMFLRTFYHPAIVCPITKYTMLSILPLAEEYQVLQVKARCEDCMIQTLQQTKQGISPIDIQTLLMYVTKADLYNLSSALPLAVQVCANYDEQLLKQDGSETKLSEGIWMKIAQERSKLLQDFAIRTIRKGDVTMVFESLQILSGLIEKDRIALMKEYEDRLVQDCTYRRDVDTFVKYVIAAEKFNLKNLLSKAIVMARNYSGNIIQTSKQYNEISDKSKREILKQ